MKLRVKVINLLLLFLFQNNTKVINFINKSLIITQNNFEKNIEMKVYPKCENKLIANAKFCLECDFKIISINTVSQKGKIALTETSKLIY